MTQLPRFPTILRKMWSGAEVQRWIDENIAPLFQQASSQRFATQKEVDDLADRLTALKAEGYVVPEITSYNASTGVMELKLPQEVKQVEFTASLTPKGAKYDEVV